MPELLVLLPAVNQILGHAHTRYEISGKILMPYQLDLRSHQELISWIAAGEDL